MSDLPDISPATWSERFRAEFERNGGAAASKSPPSAYEDELLAKPGYLRAVKADEARHHATTSMQNEIHAMLRYLVANTLPALTPEPPGTGPDKCGLIDPREQVIRDLVRLMLPTGMPEQAERCLRHGEYPLALTVISAAVNAAP